MGFRLKSRAPNVVSCLEFQPKITLDVNTLQIIHFYIIVAPWSLRPLHSLYACVECKQNQEKIIIAYLRYQSNFDHYYTEAAMPI